MPAAFAGRKKDSLNCSRLDTAYQKSEIPRSINWGYTQEERHVPNNAMNLCEDIFV